MLSDALISAIRKQFPFDFTPDQEQAIKEFCLYYFSAESRKVFILRGYAGTGKTSLVASIVKTLKQSHRRVKLLAPTGRAAKVFAQHAGTEAYTIHKVIYRQRNANDENSHFELNYNKEPNTLFIVDESSMISNDFSSGIFGSGNLLDDLMEYVYMSSGCSLMFVGDTAQLPPVGENESAALCAEILQAYNVKVFQSELTEVMRQGQQSGILQNATNIRNCILNENTYDLPLIDLNDFKDISNVLGNELIENIQYSYDHYGIDQTVVVTRSNKDAIRYNMGIRNMIFNRESELEKGDILMIVKNNYYWSELLQDKDSNIPISFLANGDIAIVENIRRYYEFYGLHFADVDICLPDYDNYRMSLRIILECLSAETPALTREQQDILFQGVWADYDGTKSKKSRMKKVKADPNYNALQVKYAYAVTCHKAQGGQWQSVYVHQGWLPPDGVDTSYYRWLYTAFTRATERLNLVNWPQNQTK